MINVHSGCIMIINIFLQIIAVGNLRVGVARQPPAGLEPAIFGLEGRRLIHWAIEAGRLANLVFPPTRGRLTLPRLKARVATARESNPYRF